MRIAQKVASSSSVLSEELLASASAAVWLGRYCHCMCIYMLNMY